MPDVVGVVFHTGGKVYYFDPNDIDLARGEQVVVQTMRGTEIGQVVDPPHTVPDEDVPAPLKRVVRRASEDDRATLVSQETTRREALAVCRDLIEKHGLDMKLVDAEIVFGGGKIVFSFYSEERVDFRALVADLARSLKVRIELRQIGAREEARMVGGLGPCGRHLCCTLFQGDQEPVSIRMAKEQNLPLNPLKISGLCGRLMCCLKYEQDQYVCFRKEAPNRGTQVQTELGPGVVVGFQVPKDSLSIRLEDGSVVDVPIDRCSCGGAPCREPAPGELGAEGAGAEVGRESAVTGDTAVPLGIVIVDDTEGGNGGGATPAGGARVAEAEGGRAPAGERILESVPSDEFGGGAAGDHDVEDEGPPEGEGSETGEPGPTRRRRPRGRRRRRGSGRQSGETGGASGGSSE